MVIPLDLHRDALARHRAHRTALSEAHGHWLALHYRAGRVPRSELHSLPELRRQRRPSNDTIPPRAA